MQFSGGENRKAGETGRHSYRGCSHEGTSCGILLTRMWGSLISENDVSFALGAGDMKKPIDALWSDSSPEGPNLPISLSTVQGGHPPNPKSDNSAFWSVITKERLNGRSIVCNRASGQDARSGNPRLSEEKAREACCRVRVLSSAKTEGK